MFRILISGATERIQSCSLVSPASPTVSLALDGLPDCLGTMLAGITDRICPQLRASSIFLSCRPRSRRLRMSLRVFSAQNRPIAGLFSWERSSFLIFGKACRLQEWAGNLAWRLGFHESVTFAASAYFVVSLFAAGSPGRTVTFQSTVSSESRVLVCAPPLNTSFSMLRFPSRTSTRID